jgi:hypothetical protein
MFLNHRAARISGQPIFHKNTQPHTTISRQAKQLVRPMYAGRIGAASASREVVDRGGAVPRQILRLFSLACFQIKREYRCRDSRSPNGESGSAAVLPIGSMALDTGIGSLTAAAQQHHLAGDDLCCVRRFVAILVGSIRGCVCGPLCKPGGLWTDSGLHRSPVCSRQQWYSIP